MSQPRAAAVLVTVLACGLGGEAGFAQAQVKPQEIEVVASDYTYTPLPPAIAAGPTIFSFVNRGKVQHELSIARLKQGVRVEDFVVTDTAVTRRRGMVERSVGILIAGPGKSPDGHLLVDLKKGATYVVYCNLKDTPGAPGHLTFGMYTAFTAK
jgi:uncharacterized cupredoxin-like copper-binding protein